MCALPADVALWVSADAGLSARCPTCWKSYLLNNLGMQTLLRCLHLWYMTLFSLTFRECVTVTTLYEIVRSLFLLCDIASGVWPGTSSCYTTNGRKLQPWTPNQIWVASANIWIPLVITLGLAAAVRKQENLSNTISLLLQRQEGNIIEQKVMRCSAEFECEQLKNPIGCSKLMVPSESCVAQSMSVSIAESARANPRRRQKPTPALAPSALSTRSAPVIMQRTSQGDCKEGGSDCLPADAVAWVQHQALPVSLCDVKVGDQVLCFDHLAQGPQYTEVSSISMEKSAAE